VTEERKTERGKKDGKGAQGREQKGGQGSPCGEKLPKMQI